MPKDSCQMAEDIEKMFLLMAANYDHDLHERMPDARREEGNQGGYAGQ